MATTRAPSYSQREEAWRAFIDSRFGDSGHPVAGQISSGATRTAFFDEELEIMQNPRFIALAKMQRNNSVLACRVPIEILSRIFWFAQPNWAPRRYSNHPFAATAASLGWIMITHVCSAWRNAALSSPSLWCEWPCYSIASHAVPDMIARSRRCQLKLSFSDSVLAGLSAEVAIDQLTIWMCQPVCQRINELSIHEPFLLHSQRNWPLFLSAPMPVLEKLTIIARGPHFPSDSDPNIVYDALTPVHLPKLSFIRLSNCTIPWDSPILNSSVTSLDLRTTYRANPTNPPTWSQFEEALNRMSLLESLVLHNLFPTFQDDHPRAGSNVLTLPAGLKNLEISATTPSQAKNCLYTLLLLVLPTSACISVRTLGPCVDVDLIAMTLSHLFETPLYAPSELVIRSHILITHDQTPWIDDDSGIAIDASLWYRTLDNQRRFTVDPQGPSDNADYLVPHMSRVRMDALQYLVITPDGMRRFQDAESWKANLSRANQVSRLALHYTPDLFHLMCALSEVVPSEGQLQSIVLFPKLKDIAFYGANLNVEVTESQRIKLHLCIVAFLHARRASGASVRLLGIQRGVMGEDELRQIEEIVAVKVFE